MIAFAEYLLKVILCSALLTGYYWLALRNKLFHAWNRFYLLATVVIAIGLPFIKIIYLQEEQQQAQPAYQVLQTITTNEVWFEEAETTPVKQSFFTAENISIGFYLLVSFITLIVLLIAIYRIIRLIKKYQHWKINKLVFVNTDARGTPFSFLRFVFWNREIDFNSEQGQQIFAHELVHVKQKHSWDKLFINAVLIIFWSNPFFWLIRKELTMIHEFIADRQSVKNHDTASFAAMILATAFPGYNMPLTNPFFYSPIKRRLQMLTKLQNPKIGYISRLLLLPLLTFLVVAFAVKTKEKTSPSVASKLNRQITVVIDAGHGFKDGNRNGVLGVNGISEDEITLAIAKKIEELNKDENLKIIFTRTDENFVENSERIRIAEENKADLLISIHESFAVRMKKGNKYVENPANGFEIYIAKEGTPHLIESKDFGSAILNEMKSVMAIREPGMKQREKGIYIIGAAPCPAVLLECGYISNPKDAAFVADEKNQKKIAEAVLKAIVNYASANKERIQFPVKNENSIKDTVPMQSTDTISKKNRSLAKFPGGSSAWLSYMEKFLQKDSAILDRDPKSVNNRCLVKFTVQKDGSITDIEILTNTESELAKISVELLKNSPRWEPALENGRPVAHVERISTFYFDKNSVKRFQEIKKTSEEETENKSDYIDKYGLCVLNGKIVTKDEMRRFIKENKEHKNWLYMLLDGASGLMQFGDKGKNGVFELTTIEIKPTAVIASENLNILYAGVENPLRIAVSQVAETQLEVTISQGIIEKRNGQYFAKNLKPGQATITISYYFKSDTKKTEEIKFKVIGVNEEIRYTPIALISGSKGGRISSEKFKQAKQLEIDDGWEITGYMVYLTGTGFPKPMFKQVMGSGYFDKDVLELISRCGPGTMVSFDEISAKNSRTGSKVRLKTTFFNLY